MCIAEVHLLLASDVHTASTVESLCLLPLHVVGSKPALTDNLPIIYLQEVRVGLIQEYHFGRAVNHGFVEAFLFSDTGYSAEWHNLKYWTEQARLTTVRSPNGTWNGSFVFFLAKQCKKVETKLLHLFFGKAVLKYLLEVSRIRINEAIIGYIGTWRCKTLLQVEKTVVNVSI